MFKNNVLKKTCKRCIMHETDFGGGECTAQVLRDNLAIMNGTQPPK